ncbi:MULTISPECIES: hypothetical protein [Rhizobium/Agrobacterium group]|nr:MULTISPECIES: hypothetical protein [Rhizobium/Agrobacterium group]WLS10111.1 hypothetical protein Q9314_12365 [Shinella sumterensis]
MRGGSMLARQLGISPLVIGLTFVAIGGGRRCGFSSAAPG